ncbi:MAG: TPM domain-containing protein [Oscillospiraceae bacterium]|nr:TPM domain-containing protein [Oscillospiraceae bacterium]
MKLRNLILILCLCALLCSSVFATKDRILLWDEADVLTDAEEEQLNSRLAEIFREEEMDVAVATVTEVPGSINSFAESYYDSHGLGQDGILLLLLISEDGNSYRYTAKGKAADIFNDAAYEKLDDRCLPHLKDHNFAKAIGVYASTAEDLISSHGKIGVGGIILSILIGAVLSFLIPMNILKGQLKTVRSQPAASSYVREGSMVLTTQSDKFLYQRVTRVAKPKDTSNSSRSGSSAGRSGHGGSF